MRHSKKKFLFVIFVFIISSMVVYGECPHICPECQMWLSSLKTNELGAITEVCVKAKCDLFPWCFELHGQGTLASINDTFPITEPDMDFLILPLTTARVSSGVGQFCVSGPFQISLPLPGIGEALTGRGTVINFTVGSIKFNSCLSKCPCFGVMEIGPCVDLNAVDEHPYHKVILNMRASDPNCDLVCAGYGGI